MFDDLMKLKTRKKENNELSLNSYKCQNCKSKFSFENDKLNNCPYCNSSEINNIEVEDLSDFLIIPFSVSLEEVIKNYKKHFLFNPLVPFKFRQRKFINTITRSYFPIYITDINLRGEVEFLSGDKEKIVKDNKKAFELKKYRVTSDVNFDYSEVVINSFSKISELEFSQIFKYKLDNVSEMKDTYLKRSIVFSSDINVEEALNSSLEKLSNNSLNIVRRSIPHQKKKLDDSSLEPKIESLKKVLVPVYFINLKYRDKNYHYFMNGSNKKTYYSLPIGILESIIFGVLLFGIIFLISYLIVKMF